MQHVENILQELFERYPPLKICEADIRQAFKCLCDCYRSGGQLLIAGNGGSASDSLHIVSELMKSFRIHRSVDAAEKDQLIALFGDEGRRLGSLLEGALPAIALPVESALVTAYSNDRIAETVFAQEVYGYGRSGDVLLAISTSGNSKNILLACMAARLKGMQIVGLTGQTGGKLADYCDVTIQAPADRTFVIQEYHLPVYHALCAMLEAAFFQEAASC